MRAAWKPITAIGLEVLPFLLQIGSILLASANQTALRKEFSNEITGMASCFGSNANNHTEYCTDGRSVIVSFAYLMVAVPTAMLIIQKGILDQGGNKIVRGKFIAENALQIIKMGLAIGNLLLASNNIQFFQSSEGNNLPNLLLQNENHIQNIGIANIVFAVASILLSVYWARQTGIVAPSSDSGASRMYAPITGDAPGPTDAATGAESPTLSA